nr:PREDICTED: actin-like [Lepisosteus oculatus]
MDDLPPATVIDNGSGQIKIGISGEREPRFIYENIIGSPKATSATQVPDLKDFYIGKEAWDKRDNLTIQYPVENGTVVSWDNMEMVWKNIYRSDLKCDSREMAVLMTECPGSPAAQREKMCALMFEEFNVPAFYVAVQAVLALFSTGRITGCVLDIGDGVSHAVPVYEGYCLPHAALRLDLAGRDITEYLASLLKDNGVSFAGAAEEDIAGDIKEKVCYVALDSQLELAKPTDEAEKYFRLPDGQVVTVHTERFRAPEILFRPEDVGMEAPGVDRLLFKTVMKSDVDLRSTLLENIVLSGGSSLFPGMERRIKKEISTLAQPGMAVKVFAPPERKISTWLGGSVLSSLSAFREMCITPAEYEEVGPNIVHQKCF